MERFHSDGLGKLCTSDEGYFRCDSSRVKLRFITSTELPWQQLAPRFCSAGYYLLSSSSAALALPCFSTSNFKMPLAGLTHVPPWIIPELSFRNKSHINPPQEKALHPPFELHHLLVSSPHPELSVLPEATKTIPALEDWAFFACPPNGGSPMH